MGPKRAPPDPELDPATASSSTQRPPSLPLPSQPQQIPTANDFSTAVKRKLSTSSRTGQACDRCKRRKIKCDRNPSGCTPCAQNRTQCHTTDRISGVPIPRGHVQQLEAQIHYYQQLNADLQLQVKELGGEPRVHPGPFNCASPPSWNATGTEGDMHGWGAEAERANGSPSPGYAAAGTVATGATEAAHLPEFKRGSIGDNYVGVSSADSIVSHIKGTSLSVFGMEIDITDFVEGASEEDYDKSPMSYKSFLKVAFNLDPDVEKVPFPDYEHLRQYALWYLRGLNPYTMLLDKPTFMNLIARIGTDPNYKPSVAETVQVHMMLAMIKYQYSLRNKDAAMMEESHKHYRYGASMFPQLYIGHELEDLQAMSMICVHLRGFAKPGAAWIMCSTTFQLAVEFGLHRSQSAWADKGAGKSSTEVEMRKRIFWTLHALAVSLSGKLGRPMPIAWADMDVEFPEPVNDSLPGEEPAKCSFRVGIWTAKIAVINSKLYRTIYAVRQSAHHYERIVRQLEKEAQEWKDQLPYDLAEGGRAGEESHIHALYLEFWYQQFQLVLHHPAVCRSTDPNFISSSLDKCLTASSRILENCDELRKHNSLDTPWINSVVYIAAIFTTLYIYHQRRDSSSSEDLSNLTNQMTLWLDVMGECGGLIGTGDKLKTALHQVIVPCLHSISEHVHKKTTEAVARDALQATQEAPQAAATYGNGNALHEAYPNAVPGPPVVPGRPSYVAPDANTVNTPSAMYPSVQTGPPFGYNNGGSAAMTGYPPTSAPYEQPSFHVADDAALSAAHVSALASAASGGPGQRAQPFIYGDTSGSNNGLPVQQYPVDVAGPTGWTSFAKTFMPSARLTGEYGPPPEYLNTANTLMSLGGREATAQDPGGIAVPHGHNTVDAGQPNIQTAGLQRVQWPENVFHILPNGGHSG